MKENKKPNGCLTAIIIFFVLIVLPIILINRSIEKHKKEVNSQKTTYTTPVSKDIYEQALDTVLNYELQNYGDQDLKGKTVFSSKFGTYVKLEKLKDYFFAYGESKANGGYYREMIKISDDECQVKIILYDNETKDKINPIWNVKGTKMTCDNSSAFNLTSELGFSE